MLCQTTMYRHRFEVAELQSKVQQEQQKADQQASVSEQLDSQLRDAQKQIKVSDTAGTSTVGEGLRGCLGDH